MTTVTFSDEKSKNQFMEQQAKLAQLNKQLTKVSAQHGASEREAKLIALTLKELNVLPETTKTYQSVGKMFLSKPIKQIKGSLESKRISHENEAKAFARAAEKLERDVKETTETVKEMLAAAKME